MEVEAEISSGVTVSYTTYFFELVRVHKKHFDNIWEITGHPLTQ